MLVYNIRKSKYATSLKASGIANRWNKEDEFIIYTGGTIALSTLELVAHRNFININSDYKLLFIKLEVDVSDITEISLDELSKNWRSLESYPMLQEMGSRWYQSKKTLLLKVPSALVQWESNYLINTTHPNFSKLVSLHATEDYIWDERLL